MADCMAPPMSPILQVKKRSNDYIVLMHQIKLYTIEKFHNDIWGEQLSNLFFHFCDELAIQIAKYVLYLLRNVKDITTEKVAAVRYSFAPYTKLTIL